MYPNEPPLIFTGTDESAVLLKYPAYPIAYDAMKLWRSFLLVPLYENSGPRNQMSILSLPIMFSFDVLISENLTPAPNEGMKYHVTSAPYEIQCFSSLR